MNSAEQKEQNNKSDPVRNILGFILGGALTIAMPIAILLLAMATGFPLVDLAVGVSFLCISLILWRWPNFSRSTKQFVLMVFFGVLVGCGFIAIAYYNMREMNSGWFQ
jgi:heme/copper-type cytochrome/quinol oxidase subunit 4